MRIGLLLSNVAVLAIILGFVLHNPHAASAPALGSAANSVASAAANPLDQLSSADIALTVARMSSLPESTAINNQAQSQAAELAVAASNDNVVSKPQVVATTLKSRADIQNYVTQTGDSLASLAVKFGVTSDSIAWSNGLTSASTINPGTNLVIPPVNGIVYTVKAGDTPASLAVQFRANADQIIAYNDAEINGLAPGEQIIIPNAAQVSGATAASISASGAAAGGFPWGGGPIYGSNGYDYGYCTWYVASQIAVPANWGNASTWAYYARLSGWGVSQAPTVGSIAQTADAAGGEGHVAIVDAVSADGSQIQIRDMNGIAGWGRVGYSGWISASTFQNFITH
ncbi:MAG TPA: LysM peptidoglycan-binding domain-containing protein [Verrucomicrobiae bacterium]|nr:LysM peptidoglycan-binding domain-containing protein [Verrucomicrobiae bacterium]